MLPHVAGMGGGPVNCSIMLVMRAKAQWSLSKLYARAPWPSA